jgi:two-component system, sensor histidine kinase and response regulator
MSLSLKIALYLALLGACIGIGSYAAISYTIFPAFEEFEESAALETIARVDRVIDAERRTFETLVVEYAHWNDTYNFALGEHDTYVEENLDAGYWRTIGVDFLLIFDVDGNLLWSADTGKPGQVPVNPQEFFPGTIGPTHPLLTYGPTKDRSGGLIRTFEGPMLVAAAPILTTYAEGPTVGTFMILRRIDESLVADVAERATAQVRFSPVHESGVAGYSLDDLQQMAAADDVRHVRITDDRILGHRLVRDVTGTPAAMVEIEMPHMITVIGADTIRAAMMLIGLVTAAFLIVGLIFLRFIVVRPVNELAQNMHQIRETGNLNIQIEQGRSDEIGSLAREFSEMTSNLELTQRELEATRDVALEASRAKSEFLARMSHEIRTPMNGVLGMTELLRNTALDFEQRRFTETIYASAESLLDIINDILDFSKIEAGKMTLEKRDINLGSVIEETVDSLASQAHKKGLELINDVAPAVHTSLLGDAVRIRQVLTNLVANAIKFTNRGEVVVRATASAETDSHMDITLEVIDTGMGIKPEKQALIFDSFAQEDGSTTRLHGGTGLGLAISQQLVDLMGGKLAVESTPGLGSRFYFTVRMRRGSAAPNAQKSRMKSVAGKRILVVDDNATNREILEQHLKSWRAHPECAEDGAEALLMLERAAAENKPYEMAILDMHMPRMDGLQLARRVREHSEFDNVPLMLLSSVAMPASEDVLHELNISGQLTKPIRQSQLYDSLAVVLSGQMLSERYSRKGSTAMRELHGKVLLAEDNPVNQAVALGMLDSLGVDVAVVTDGQAAIRATESQHFDLVLMDCQMPVMDGLEATRRIRAAEVEQNRSRLAIVALTANALSGDRELCLEAGMDEYLGKPFTMDQLHAVLSMFLRNAGETGHDDPPEEELSAEAASLFDTQSITAQPLDRSALAVLSDLQQPGAPCLISKVIGIYLESSTQLKDRLVSAIDGDDIDTARESAHALKSSSINVGATRLADLCKEIENDAREESLREAREVKPKLEQEYVRVISALKTELESVRQ